MAKLTGKPLLVRILNEIHVFQQNYIQAHNVVLNQRLGARIDYENLLAVLKQVREVLTAVHELLKDPASMLIGKQATELFANLSSKLQH